jgi:hypothetical protein
MADEWFRSPDWSEQARAEFERRLARSRAHSRAQYLRIKGLALEGAGEVEAARSLWLRVLSDDGEHSELQGFGAMEHLGDSYAATDPDLAEHYYRCLIVENPRLNMTTTLQYVKLAELLIRRGQPADLREASDLLVTWVDAARSPFPNAQFRWNLAAIELGEAAGDRTAVREAARRALDCAAVGAPFSRHKNVGLVETDKRTLKRLERLAR